jgi:hypothetical protein
LEAPFDRTGIFSDPVRRTKFVGGPSGVGSQTTSSGTDELPHELGTKATNDLNVDEMEQQQLVLKNSLLTYS